MDFSFEGIDGRALELFREKRRKVFEQTDVLFAKLAAGQFVLGLFLAFWISPYTYRGAVAQWHVHLALAVVMGFLASAPMLYLGLYHPGEVYTRYTVAGCQMLTSALLIHLSGGRIETHFHIFGSLAFLSFYRDWRVFVPSTVVITIDHLVRGMYFPESVFGIAEAGDWRWAEHAAWVLFCDYFLVKSVRQQAREMWDTAKDQAALENAAEVVEQKVQLRTAELELEREKFENAFVSAPIGMALVDARTLLLLKANSQFAKVAQSEPGELGGSDFEAFFIDGKDAPELSRMRGREVSIEAEICFLGRQGGKARVLLGAHLLRGSNAYVVQTVDITKRVEAERQVREQSELMMRSQKLESLGVLTGGIAHELNSPIQFIGSNLKFLRESFEDIQQFLEPVLACDSGCFEALKSTAEEMDLAELLGDMQSAVSESSEGVGRIAAIVKSMRDYSHPGGQYEALKLNEILQTTSTVARNEIKYVADIEMDLDPELTPVMGNRGELMQVFLNVLVNAVHAIQEKVGQSGARGLIRVVTRNLPDAVEVAVSDTGVGMSAEVRNRIFDPFFTTKPVGKGTGQGLAITHTIIANHDAKMSVESEVGVGTTMTLTFPQAGTDNQLLNRVA